MPSETFGSVRWDMLCAVSTAIADYRGEIRDDLVYIREGIQVSTSGVAVDTVFDRRRGSWLFGYTEAQAMFRWDFGDGAFLRAMKLGGCDLWGLEFYGPKLCTYHRIVRDALMASAIELLPG